MSTRFDSRDDKVTDVRDHEVMDSRDDKVRDDRVAAPRDDEIVVEQVPADDRPATNRQFSLAQLIAVAIGAGFVILGVAALARTGFSTDHLFRPQHTVWTLRHSPLMGAIEVGFGALMIVAGVVPGAARSLMALLGVVAAVFGAIVLVDVAPQRLHHWLGVSDRGGWLFLITGVVTVLVAFFAPMFVRSAARQETRVHHVAR